MTDDRLKNVQPKEKSQRMVEDRPSRVEDLDEQSVEDLLRGTLSGSILPDPPTKPGYHRIWLSEQSQANPISWYERLGYRKVHPNDVDGFGQNFLKSPSGVEEVRCNEMLLYEIPDNIYQRIMKLRHHDEPLELQGQPIDSMRSKYSDPKTGESLFKDESDEFAREEAKRKVPVPRFN